MNRSSTIFMSLETLALGVLLSACGNSGSGSIGSEPFTQRSVKVPTVYTTQLTALNKNYVPGGNPTGAATVTIDGDTVTIKMAAAGVEPNIMHMAHIHKGVKCPDMTADDANHDGVVDVVEGIPAYGFILVNFGADLSSLENSLKGGAPMADDTGTVNYTGSGSYSAMVDDLHNRPEQDPTTGIGKLPSAEDFKPDEGVIVVHGVAPTTALPASVMGLAGSTPQATLPILCGRLEVAITPAAQ